LTVLEIWINLQFKNKRKENIHKSSIKIHHIPACYLETHSRTQN